MAWIGMMIVHTDFRRRGIGAALMRLALGYALARHGRTATHIGPLVATTASAAERLLEGMLARLLG